MKAQRLIAKMNPKEAKRLNIRILGMLAEGFAVCEIGVFLK